MDDRDQLRGIWANRCAQLEQQLSFLPLQKDPLLGHPSTEYFVFGLEQFNLSAQFVLSAPCQIEQKRRKPTCHAMAPYVIDEVEIDDDKLFALLGPTVQLPFYFAEVPTLAN